MIDFPLAWRVMAETTPEYHHEKCSYRQTNRGMLCDCAAQEAILALDKILSAEAAEVQP